MYKYDGFFRGMGSVIEIFPSSHNVNISLPTHTDAEAFNKDLEQVGSDMRHGMEAVDISLNKKEECYIG